MNDSAGRWSRRRFMATAGGLALAAGCGKVAPPRPATTSDFTLKAGPFTAAPDGTSRVIWGYDQHLPGPVIRAREGDTLRIAVHNGLDRPTSVHWHGMHQPGTWQMDGVADVSRPPIPAGSDFTYEYRATPAGTHWYHSHTGVQYGDGLFGPLIIEEATPIAKYDRDEIVMMNDWFHEPGDVLLARLIKMGEGPAPPMKKGGRDVGDLPFQSGLINGKGRGPDGKGARTEFQVKKGETIRFRLINASSTYALRFRIDGHPLTVIASDGPALQPVTVDHLTLAIGERYDVLLKADRPGVHWLRAATLDGKEFRAVLRYAGAEGEPADRPVEWGPRGLRAEDLRALNPIPLQDRPRELTLTLGGTMQPYRWSINDQQFPKADPIKLARGESVRFLMENPTMMDHPFHLHGHSFHVLGPPGQLNTTDPPLKDTVSIPAKGALVLQWVATNPGRWFFHCHIEWHLATGMARVIEIG